MVKTATAATQQPGSPIRIHPPKDRSPIQQAVALQRVIMAQAEGETVTGAAVAQLARAWADLEQLKRDIRMKPKPKPVDVSHELRKPKSVGPALHPDDTPMGQHGPKAEQ